MGDLIKIQDYKDSKGLEEEYQKFLVYVNKFIGIPSKPPEIVKAFYLCLRYLEGTINCLQTLDALGLISDIESHEIHEMVSTYLKGLETEL